MRAVARGALALLVVLWVVPTLGLLLTSLRTPDQIAQSGWWRAASPVMLAGFVRTGAATEPLAGGWVAAGSVLAPEQSLIGWGVDARTPDAFRPGETADLGQGRRLSVLADGRYTLWTPERTDADRGTRIFITTRSPPRLKLDNYARVIGAEGLGRAVLNTMTVTIPATVLPIAIAAFAAYALAWMELPGKSLLIAALLCLMAMPLQLALIPLLKLHGILGIGKSYVGIWLAHTGFGLPLMVYLLHGYMLRLPTAIIASARLDGASELRIFARIVLPLCAPALAALAALQFLWVWNDLLVALVFLGNRPDQLVLTGALRDMLGSRGGAWNILAASAFVSMLIPLAVFVLMQKYLMRGMLTGAVKGG